MGEAKENQAKELLLTVTTSPHLRATENVTSIMYGVIISLVPVIFASIYFFRLDAVIIILVSTLTCMMTEYLIQTFLRKQKATVFDGSAVITGILLALTLPPTFPVYATVLGAFVAIAIGKQVFGGLGYNIFNPALVGRAFLMATYPVLMTTWVTPITTFKAISSVTAHSVSTATPLALMKFSQTSTALSKLLIGNTGGCIGETSVIAILIGASYLFYKNYIDWRIPVSYIGTTFLFGGLLYLLFPGTAFPPLFHIFSGGLMLGAFYMATDMVTSPVTPLGSWIFGFGAGVLVVLIRVFGGLPEGVMYSILFMNALTPMINRYTQPKLLGEK